jgi:hypothetical protein
LYVIEAGKTHLQQYLETVLLNESDQLAHPGSIAKDVILISAERNRRIVEAGIITTGQDVCHLQRLMFLAWRCSLRSAVWPSLGQ